MLKNFKSKCSNIIFVLGIVLRIIYGFKATLNINQHDVLFEGGHFNYAAHIFMAGTLPNSRYGQFYQPPLNAIFQALFMKIESIFFKPNHSILRSINAFSAGDYNLLFKDNKLYRYVLLLYSNTKILSVIYSILILFIIYKILKLCLNKSDYVMKVVLAMCSFYPGMVYMAGQYNNDPLSYLFIFMSMYFFIKWFKNPRYDSIVLLAVSIGLGVLTKISVGLITLVFIPLILVKLTKYRSKTIVYQLMIFILVVTILSLSYALRNFILFNQPLNYVRRISETNPLYIKNDNVFERFFPFYFKRLVVQEYNIYHAQNEFNIWIDYLKTSVFGEYTNINTIGYFANIVMLFCGVYIYLLSILSYIYELVKFVIVVCIFKSKKVFEFITDNLLKIICILLVTIGLAAFSLFNWKYPASCSSHFRYVAYMLFASSCLIGMSLEEINGHETFIKIIKKSLDLVIFTLFISYSIFVLFVL